MLLKETSMLLAPMVAVKRTLALSDAGIYKPRPRLVGVVGESLVEETALPDALA